MPIQQLTGTKPVAVASWTGGGARDWAVLLPPNALHMPHMNLPKSCISQVTEKAHSFSVYDCVTLCDLQAGPRNSHA